MKSNTLKNIFYSTLTILAVFGAGACSDDALLIPEPEGGSPVSDGYVTLRIECADVATRATEDGIDALNENRIESVTLCLWPNGGDWLTDREPLYMETFTGIDATGEAVIRLPLTTHMLSSLFNQDSSATCHAFAAVNVDPTGAATVEDLRRLAISSDFATVQVQKAFAMDGDGIVTLHTAPVTGALYATGTIPVIRSAAKIDLHLNVEKQIKETMADGSVMTWIPDYEGMTVMMRNAVSDSTLDPDPDSVNPDHYFTTSSDLTYGFTRVDSSTGDAAYDGDYPFEQTIPFYSYPNSWDSSDPDDPGRSNLMVMIPWSSDGGETYKTCYYRVPVVDPKLDELVRNTAYHVYLHVSVLGSFLPDEPMLIDDLSYRAADWNQEHIEANITEVRYLVVDQKEYEVNNEESISIPFYTSHETVVTAATMTFTRFNFSDQGSPFDVTVTQEQSDLSKTRNGEEVFNCTFDNKEKKLVVKHPLKVFEPWQGNTTRTKVDLTNGDGQITSRPRTQTDEKIKEVLDKIRWYKKTSDDEYSKIVFEVTVQHKDMKGTTNFTETVRITQYPGIYIDAVSNYTAKNADSFNYTGAQGSTYINGKTDRIPFNSGTAGGGVENGYMTSIGLNSTSYLNWNPNLYLVTITRLPNNSKYKDYIISDPRSTKINNTLDNTSMKNDESVSAAWKKETFGGQSQAACVTAKDLDGNERKLKYYYPALEGNSTKNVISPKFRICSSYGGTGNILDRVLARRRAASYQEMGYAAGRWRLPTYAEVKFVMDLAAEYKIPRLFGRSDNTDWWYWCAQGCVKVPGKQASDTHPSLDNSKTNSSPERARFVYDEWYWGDETLPVTGKLPNARWNFTWGDRKR